MRHYRIFNMLIALIIVASFSQIANAAKDKKDEEAPAVDKEALAAKNAEYDRTPYYVNKWVKTPALSGARLGVNGNLTYKHKKGRHAVFVFLASWSEPSQSMMKHLLEIERKYESLDTDFVYIFAHDTREDAEGFFKHFELNSGMLANAKILTDFKVQQLPTIIVGDRNGWLTQIYQNVESPDIEDLEDFLKLQTAL